MRRGCVWGQQNPANDPGINQHNPQYANHWAPLARKRHIPPHSAQPRHTNRWAPLTRKRHQQEQRPQRPTESSDPTQYAKGRTGDCPGPRKGATTRRNVTRGGGVDSLQRVLPRGLPHGPPDAAPPVCHSTPGNGALSPHHPPPPARRSHALRGMHWKGGRYPRSRAPSLCPATAPLTPSASLNGICNRQ